MRIRQAQAMFEAVTALVAAQVGCGFEAYPSDFDDQDTVLVEPDDYLNVWTEINDPDNPTRNTRHYSLVLKPVPFTFEVSAVLLYGFAPEGAPDAKVLFKGVFNTFQPDPNPDFQTGVGERIARCVLDAISAHEGPYLLAYHERAEQSGGAA